MRLEYTSLLTLHSRQRQSPPKVCQAADSPNHLASMCQAADSQNHLASMCQAADSQNHLAKVCQAADSQNHSRDGAIRVHVNQLPHGVVDSVAKVTLLVAARACGKKHHKIQNTSSMACTMQSHLKILDLIGVCV